MTSCMFTSAFSSFFPQQQQSPLKAAVSPPFSLQTPPAAAAAKTRAKSCAAAAAGRSQKDHCNEVAAPSESQDLSRSTLVKMFLESQAAKTAT